MENNDWFSARRWLSRLSLSFFIVSFWLLYTGYNGWKNHTFEEWRLMLTGVASLLSFVLGLMGVRERHRPWNS